MQLIKDQRLSQAFPPNSVNNTRYVADVHDALANSPEEFTFGDIKFRTISTKRDIAQLKALQQEWFPINYSEQFYQSILQSRTQSLAGEIEIRFPTGRKEKYIIAAMVYQLRESKGKYNGKQTWKQWFCSFFKTHYAQYIMTIGVINEFRGRGIAEYMIDKLKQTVRESNQMIDYIYLDMVSYNEAAARFYQKNGFRKARVKKNHYSIENQTFDAYVYVWQPD